MHAYVRMYVCTYKRTYYVGQLKLTVTYVCTCILMQRRYIFHLLYICIYCVTTGALSVTDDDYCISYTITMVDVHSCIRPPRLLMVEQQHISVHPHVTTPPRSHDQTHVSEQSIMSRQPTLVYPKSTSIGEYFIISGWY